MVSENVVIKNEQGFHMRPAGVFSKTMAKFNSDVIILFNGKKINAKSVMSIIAGCIKSGSMITISCDGQDEKEALSEAVSLIESGIGDE